MLSLVPLPFLFHYYETTQYINGGEAPFLFPGTILFVIVVGLLSVKVKLRYIMAVNLVTIMVSVLLGKEWITPPNVTWFKPLTQDSVVIFTGIVLLIGKLVVRLIAKIIRNIKENHFPS
ncbi:hypothetical protein [Thalassobacillus devorans]|uniref:hypothetical protein n=1 Tax=Thalassobacillus devorans TaxID=279813 RepID=UPI000A1CE50C|nr:hypothetical protein [Thalassobacillus devorans]